MPRPLSPEREQEFQELLAFNIFMFDVLHKEAPPGFSFASECERIAKKYGRSKALIGLRQATNDIVEDLSDRSPEGLAALDEALSAARITTFSEIRRRYASAYQRILKRGAIKSEAEYYLVNGIVVDLTSAVSEEERALLQRLLYQFESGIDKA